MFDFIRNHRRWMQFILLVLIVPSFFLVGVSGYDSFVGGGPEMASVGNTAIKRPEFDVAHRDQLERMRQQLGTQFDLSLIDTPAMRQRLLEQMIDQHLLSQAAADNRFSVSDETLRNTIASIPAVQDDGRFSPERYRQVLAAQGMTPATFELGLRRDLAIARVVEPVGQSTRVPESVAASLASALTQTRTVQLRRYAANDFRAAIQVSQSDIQAWYDKNQSVLRVPDYVSAQYVVLDETAASQGVQVKEADIAPYYEQNKARFGQLERRRVSHIMIEVPSGATDKVRQVAREKAENVVKQAQAKPADFAELARQYSQDAGSAQTGGDLGWVSKGMFKDAFGPALESAIYGLGKDQVSGVVAGPSGFHIIKVTEIEPATIKPLAEVREQIVGEIRKQIAATRFADMATKLTSIVNDQRASLQPAANASDLKIRTVDGIARDRLLPATQVGAHAAAGGPDAELLNNPRVREALFSPELLQEKFNSGVIEISPDTMIAVRVEKMTPAHVPPLAAVEQQVRDRLVQQRAQAAAEKAGAALLATLQKDPAASTEGFAAAIQVSRQQAHGLTPGVLSAVMRLPAQPLPAYTGVADGTDYVLVRLEKIDPGSLDAAQRTEFDQQLTGAWAQAEDQAVIKMLREHYKVKITPEAAAIIKGDQPATAG